MQCEVTPARRSPQIALVIVTALATMAITGAFVKQQNELDRQADRLRRLDLELAAMKAPKWMGAITSTGTNTLGGLPSVGEFSELTHSLAIEARPTVSECGLGATVEGWSSGGTVRPGIFAKRCVVTFGKAFHEQPVCALSVVGAPPDTWGWSFRENATGLVIDPMPSGDRAVEFRCALPSQFGR